MIKIIIQSLPAYTKGTLLLSSGGRASAGTAVRPGLPSVCSGELGDNAAEGFRGLRKKCAPPGLKRTGDAHKPKFTDNNSSPLISLRPGCDQVTTRRSPAWFSRKGPAGRDYLIQSKERTELFNTTSETVNNRHRLVFALIHKAVHTALSKTDHIVVGHRFIDSVHQDTVMLRFVAFLQQRIIRTFGETAIHYDILAQFFGHGFYQSGRGAEGTMGSCNHADLFAHSRSFLGHRRINLHIRNRDDFLSYLRCLTNGRTLVQNCITAQLLELLGIVADTADNRRRGGAVRQHLLQQTIVNDVHHFYLRYDFGEQIVQIINRFKKCVNYSNLLFFSHCILLVFIVPNIFAYVRAAARRRHPNR